MQHLTPRAQQVLALARKESERLKHGYIGSAHLLLGLIRLGQGVAVNVLRKMGMSLENVREAVVGKLGNQPPTEKTDPNASYSYSEPVKKVLISAAHEASKLKHNYVGTEHILLGLLTEKEGVASEILKELGIDLDLCRKQILAELDPKFVGDLPETPEQDMPMSEGGERGADPSKQQSALKAFGRDLTELAKNGKLDPVVGRSNEIMRVIAW